GTGGHAADATGGVAGIGHDPPGGIGDTGQLSGSIVAIGGGAGLVVVGNFFGRDQTLGVVGVLNRPVCTADPGEAANAVIAVGSVIVGVGDVLRRGCRVLDTGQAVQGIVGVVHHHAATVGSSGAVAGVVVGEGGGTGVGTDE